MPVCNRTPVPLPVMRLISYMSPGFPTSLFHQIGRVLGVDVDFDETSSGPTPGNDPFADGSADLGWVCSTSYVDLETRGDDAAVQLVGVAWVPDDPDSNGAPVYFGDLVTRADSGITTFDDLAGRRVGCNDPVSLSGYHALRIALHERGLPDSFCEQPFTGGHHASLDMVVAGDLDAALVDSVVRTGRARMDPAVDALTVIERLGPWPTQPLVARKSLATEDVRRVRRQMLAASGQPALQAELEAAALSHLVEVGPDHYAAIRTAMATVETFGDPADN